MVLLQSHFYILSLRKEKKVLDVWVIMECLLKVLVMVLLAVSLKLLFDFLVFEKLRYMAAFSEFFIFSTNWLLFDLNIHLLRMLLIENLYYLLCRLFRNLAIVSRVCYGNWLFRRLVHDKHQVLDDLLEVHFPGNCYLMPQVILVSPVDLNHVVFSHGQEYFNC